MTSTRLAKYKIGKEVGKGLLGTMYETKPKSKYIIKIEHITEDDITPNIQSSTWVENEMGGKLALKYPEHFQVLYDYIIGTCGYIQTFDKMIDLLKPEAREKLLKIAQSKYCITRLYEKIDSNLYTVGRTLKTRNEWLSEACQIYSGVQIMHKNGYNHLGISMANIGVNFVNYNKTIKIGDAEVPTFGKQYKLLCNTLTTGPGCDMTKYKGRTFNGYDNLETFDSVRALACTFMDNLYEYMIEEKPPYPADYKEQIAAKIDRKSWPLSELSDDHIKSSRMLYQIYYMFYSEIMVEIFAPTMVGKLTAEKYLNDSDYIFMIKNYENVPAIVRYLVEQLTHLPPTL